jgi:hypothetical protein
VTMTGTGDNANLPAGGNAAQVTFTGKGSKATNTAPTSFAVNGVACN